MGEFESGSEFELKLYSRDGISANRHIRWSATSTNPLLFFQNMRRKNWNWKYYCKEFWICVVPTSPSLHAGSFAASRELDQRAWDLQLAAYTPKHSIVKMAISKIFHNLIWQAWLRVVPIPWCGPPRNVWAASFTLKWLSSSDLTEYQDRSVPNGWNPRSLPQWKYGHLMSWQ